MATPVSLFSLNRFFNFFYPPDGDDLSHVDTCERRIEIVWVESYPGPSVDLLPLAQVLMRTKYLKVTFITRDSVWRREVKFLNGFLILPEMQPWPLNHQPARTLMNWMTAPDYTSKKRLLNFPIQSLTMDFGKPYLLWSFLKFYRVSIVAGLGPRT
jgi:hypothetical protein